MKSNEPLNFYCIFAHAVSTFIVVNIHGPVPWGSAMSQVVLHGGMIALHKQPRNTIVEQPICSPKMEYPPNDLLVQSWILPWVPIGSISDIVSYLMLLNVDGLLPLISGKIAGGLIYWLPLIPPHMGIGIHRIHIMLAQQETIPSHHHK